MPTNIPNLSFASIGTAVHEQFMRQCLDLAREAAVRNESPVGSLLVRENLVIGRGIEGVKSHNDFTFHAEIECIRQGAATLGTRRLDGCVLYSTHEPCIMCSYLIRQSRIPMLVFAVPSGEKGGFYSRYPILTDETIASWGTPPLIVTGILAKECSRLK